MRPRLPAAVRNAALWLRRFAATTPGAIGVVVLVVVTLCLLAGFTSANQLSGKISRHESALDRTEPLAYAAQNLYVSLSAADAAAAEAFLSGGIEAPDVRVRYQTALADAAAALADATVGANDKQTRLIVARISAELPAYTGLVETARANNRQGFPVGSAYLREASALMQDSLLKNAEKLSTDRFAAVNAEQGRIGALPWASLALLLLVLIACGAGSYVLLERTNRRFNVGLAVAAGATALAMIWVVVATTLAGSALDGGEAGAAKRFETLAEARILAQQARTAETLQLITRGDIAEGEETFTQHTTALRDRLTAVTGAESDASQRFQSWTTGHRKQVEAYQAAKFTEAVDQAIGRGAETSATKFASLDESLRQELTRVRGELRGGVDSAGDALSYSPSATLLLMLFAAAAVIIGLWPRVKEFL
ncbi:hypothetical protein [Nocardia sp. XZ_19_385]|uniref:hypothetical protein n=1 Tax=Nocardia sp. XZ_19_385 TaxID=2769488 RepID=UPI0028167842|nr:hypothetical protein [Nocardia sp. XZ_19_385]